MAYLTFPTSPVPAPLRFFDFWNESIVNFDSGAYQGSTAFQKPMRRYSFSGANMPRTKQQSLSAFWNIHKGRVTPWLFGDPYDIGAQGGTVKALGPGITSFYLKDTGSFNVIARSGFLRITSTLSGVLTQGSHYVLNQDTGIIVASLTPASGDTWTASGQTFRKCHFTSDLSQDSPIWNQFGMEVTFEEIL